MYKFTYRYMHTYTYTYIYIRIHTYTYIHIHTVLYSRQCFDATSTTVCMYMYLSTKKFHKIRAFSRKKDSAIT